MEVGDAATNQRERAALHAPGHSSSSSFSSSSSTTHPVWTFSRTRRTTRTRTNQFMVPMRVRKQMEPFHKPLAFFDVLKPGSWADSVGPRTVPVRSGLAGPETSAFSQPARANPVLRAGTVRGPFRTMKKPAVAEVLPTHTPALFEAAVARASAAPR